jgi:hypothetical protein
MATVLKVEQLGSNFRNEKAQAVEEDCTFSICEKKYLRAFEAPR